MHLPVQIYPMPFSDSFSLTGENLNSTAIFLKVFDVNGSLISTQQINIANGTFKSILDVC